MNTISVDGYNRNLAVVIAILSTAIFATVYYLFLFVSVCDHDYSYDKTDSAQQFYTYTMKVFFPVFLIAIPVIWKYTKDRNAFCTYLLFFGILATITGLVGLNTIPYRSTLVGAGGLSFDFGHTVNSHSIDGALWLILIFTAWIPYTYGYLLKQTDKLWLPTIGLLFVAGTSVYFALHTFFGWGNYATVV